MKKTALCRARAPVEGDIIVCTEPWLHYPGYYRERAVGRVQVRGVYLDGVSYKVRALDGYAHGVRAYMIDYWTFRDCCGVEREYEEGGGVSSGAGGGGRVW